MLIVLTGGARSGKSSAAVAAAEASAAPVVFVATAEAHDAEMATRIARHRAERPAAWTVVEEPRDLATAVTGADAQATVVIDCLALWVANLMGDDAPDGSWEDDTVAAADELAARLASRPGLTIVVTNEVGSGIVPDNASARAYRDVLGRVNQVLVAQADAAHLCVAGRLLALHPADSLGV